MLCRNENNLSRKAFLFLMKYNFYHNTRGTEAVSGAFVLDNNIKLCQKLKQFKTTYRASGMASAADE